MNTVLDKLKSFLIDLNITPEVILSWFRYNPEHPMLFNSSLFLGFFLVFYLVYILTKKHSYFRTVYVLLFSLFFYYKVGGIFIILLLFSSVLNFVISKAMYLSQKEAERKFYLVFAILVNLFFLAYFKYTYFLLENINTLFHYNFTIHKIILPVGISFFTFQAISYIVDLYRKQIEPARNILDFSFYLCFFPQLVAGPIVRAKEFLPQIHKKIILSKKEASIAMFMILSGLVKKAIISDYISSNFVDRVFDSPLLYSPFENLMAVYGYTLQIYCDFSGYSDMAIGIALLMGFTLPLNFDSPYKSKSITEFWRRWHISLSSWLRDYLYIPMGGNRKGKARTYINLIITMLIGGLWHGAAWKYVIWGGLHGVALAVERFFKQRIKFPKSNILVTIFSVFLTFNFIAFCWIFFRASNLKDAYTVIHQIANLNLNTESWIATIEGYKYVFVLIFIGLVLHLSPTKLVSKVKQAFEASPLIAKVFIVAFVFWLVYATASSEPQPFIYSKF